MRRLVCEYYDGFSFGKMIRQYPELRGTLTDLLIGDLFPIASTRCGGRSSRCTKREERRFRSGTPARPRWLQRTRQTCWSCPRGVAAEEVRRGQTPSHFVPAAGRQVVKSDQVDVLAFAVLRDLQQIVHACEA